MLAGTERIPRASAQHAVLAVRHREQRAQLGGRGLVLGNEAQYRVEFLAGGISVAGIHQRGG
jgi:hypothetical protein